MTTLATWNCGDGADRTKARGLDMLAHRGADIIGLQEAGDRGRMIDRWCELTGWRAFFGDLPGSSSVPILWNPKTVRAIHAGTTPATPPTKVGKLGAGPSTMKAKVWNRARFEIRDTRIEFVFINGHVVPSVYLPKRRALAKRHIAVLAEMVERRAGKVPVVAVGDFNMTPHHALTKPLRDLGMTQRTRKPTHGRRTIDLVWTLDVDGRAEVVNMPSDHRAVLFNIKEK